MINVPQLINEIIWPTCDAIGLDSPEATALLLGTCAQESLMGTYVKQVSGPALGIYQMEVATYIDIFDNFLSNRKNLKGMLYRYFYWNHNYEMPPSMLVSNLSFATAMARIHYFRVSEPLPCKDDIQGMAQYWKDHYNTKLGRGTTEDFVQNYQRFVAPYEDVIC